MAKTPVKTETPALAGPIDMSLLTKEEIAEIEALAESSVAEERKKSTKAHVLEQAKLKARRKLDPKQEMVNVTIDVAEYADRIVIDGTVYMHGHTYTVPRARANVIQDIMFRTWGHQAEVDGKKKDFYRKAKNVVLTPAA